MRINDHLSHSVLYSQLILVKTNHFCFSLNVLVESLLTKWSPGLFTIISDVAHGQEARRSLNIMPQQQVQKYPVGKQMMLTCVPNVPDINLITDLQWTDNQNYTVQPKP